MRANRLVLAGVIAGLLLTFVVRGATAQPPTPVPPGDIRYNMTVEGAIAGGISFDWWRFEGSAGDEIRIRMAAADGLAPLIGLLDGAASLIAQSAAGEVDGAVQLGFTLPRSGNYTIVATRVGINEGTTTGSYSLTLQLTSSAAAAPALNLQPLVFDCQGVEATTVFTLRYIELADEPGPNLITVYGLDGFQPVIRALIEGVDPLCSTDGEEALGDVVTLPGAEPLTITNDDFGAAARFEIDLGGLTGFVTYMIGSADGAPGRYLAVIDGFTVEPRADLDALTIWHGPRPAANTDLLVYMVGTGANSRLDPFLRFYQAEGGCDDAGGRGCESIPSIAGVGVTLADGRQLVGDRFDAGLRIPSGDLDYREFELGSFSGNTSGQYALMIVGELLPPPPTTAPPE
ncbi:MAG: hypothetical protein GYB67_00335 [Chloroflexi bacterium]|nr:hypothetical protein [Chloroflexota bacterium]